MQVVCNMVSAVVTLQMREQLCVFYIQVGRATSKGSNGGQRTVRILGYIEKEHFFPIIGSAKQSRVLCSDGPIDTELKQSKAEGETSGSSVAGTLGGCYRSPFGMM